MSPFLGMLDSAKTGHLNTFSGDFVSIATATVTSGGSGGTITFSSIPQTYTHLQLRAYAFQSSGTAGIGMQFNTDTSSSDYAWHDLVGNGSSASASSGTGGNNIYIGDMGTSTSPGVFVIDILDYTNTNKNKVVRSLNGYDANGSGTVSLHSGVWLNNTSSAINSLTIMGATFAQNSVFALYGIR
jgi:hypothetical protein